MDAAANEGAAASAGAEPFAAAPPAHESGWARARSLAQYPLVSYVIAFALALGVYHHAYGALAKHGMTGDEPSYLLDAFSMARDGDRNLAGQNSHDLIALFGIPAYPHTIHNTSAGDISIHGAGTALDVVPAVWIGDWQGNPIRWVRLELVLIDALTALALFALIRRVAQLLRVRQAFTWVAWGATAASLPLVAYSEQLYPEVPALLCILLAINAAIRPRPRWPLVLAGSVAACYLPWLHIRFIPTCFALLAALALRGLGAVAAESRDGPEPQRGLIAGWAAEARGILRALVTRAGALVMAAAIVPAVVSFGLMAVEFQHWYGSPNWTITAGGGGVPTQITDTWYPMVLGGLFGTDYGWVPWAPVAVLAIAAAGCLLLEAPRWTACALAVIAVYQAELAVSGLATPGFVFPGRYEIICIPLFGVALMVALARVPVAWLAFIPLLIATLAISWQASERPEANLLNTGAVGLPMAAHLTSAFPDVEPVTPPTSFTADPTSLAGTIGHVARKGKVLRSTAADKAGFLAAGPRVPLAAGVYMAHFLIAQRGGRGHAPLAELQVWSITSSTPLASTKISAAELPAGRPKQFDLQFTTPGALPIETRVYATGRATIELTGTSAVPLALAPLPVLDRYPDGSLMAAWGGGTLFVGALLAYAAYLRRRVTGREALRPLS
jgi:hypothetical protein